MDLFDDLPDPVTDTPSDENDSKKTINDLKRKVDVVNCSDDIQPAAKKSLLNQIESNGKNCHIEHLFRIKSFVTARKGEREEMQDAHVAIDDFTPQLRNLSSEVSRVSFFGVYDGHAGIKASQMAAKRLHIHLAEKFPRGPISQIEKDIKRVLFDVYKKTDEEFLKQAGKIRPHWKDGSTAVTVLIVNNTLYIANIGDSKVVLARESHSPTEHQETSQLTEKETSKSPLLAIALSRDHNPIDYEERQRIQKTGGIVRDGRVGGILEVSRSFGDYQFKKQGVTCIPDVKKCQLTDKDKFLIIACDGLWKTFSNEEAVSLVNKILVSNSDELKGYSDAHTKLMQTACNRLANDAVLKLSGDNVTVMLIDIAP